MLKESQVQALACYSPELMEPLPFALLIVTLSHSPVALTQSIITRLPQLTSEPFGISTHSVSLPKLHAVIGRNTIVLQSTLAETPRIIALEADLLSFGALNHALLDLEVRGLVFCRGGHYTIA